MHRASPKFRLLMTLSVLLITFGVTVPSIGNDFVFDDRLCVKAFNEEYQQPHEMIATLQPVSEYFTSHYLRGASSGSRSYRPLTVLTYAWTFHLFCGGRIEVDSAVPHRWINVLLQVLNTWLALLILRQLCGTWPALIGALMFGVHSIHTEVVAGIVGRGELMGFAFGATSLLLYLRGVGRERWPRIGYLAAAAVAQFLASCSKESALAWFAFLPMVRLAQHLMRPNANLWRDIRAALWLGIVPVALFLGLYAYVIANAPAYQTSYLTNPIHGAYVPVATRLLTATMVWAYAVYLTLAPFSLSCDYGANVFTLAESFTDPRVLVAVVTLGVLLGGGFAVARRQPLLFLAMACFFGFSFIASNVPIAQETIFAERNYYTPSLALSLMVAAGLSGKLQPWLRRSLAVIIAGWVVACGVVDLQRMRDWRDNESLFNHDLAHQPRSLRLLNCVANLHQDAGRDREYFATLEMNLRVEPDDPKALIRMAHFLMARKQYAAVAEVLQRCQDSRLLRVIDPKEHESRLYKLFGHLRTAEGRWAEAVAMFKRGTEVDPDYVHLVYSLIRAQLRAATPAAAQATLVAANSRFPGDPVLELLAGKILFHRGRFGDAEQVLRNVLPKLRWGTFQFDDVLDLVESVRNQGRVPDSVRLLQDWIQKGGGGVPPEHRERAERLRRG